MHEASDTTQLPIQAISLLIISSQSQNAINKIMMTTVANLLGDPDFSRPTPRSVNI